MTPSSDLFDLVKSLTRSEKRFFKVYSKRHVIGGENNYLRLYDALNEMDSYDETRLKEKLQGEKFLQRLSTEKVHLYNLLLKAMLAYRSDKSPARTISDMVDSAEFLTERGLFAQSTKILRKARKLARQYNEFISELRIINLERVNLKKIKGRSEEEFLCLIEASEEVLALIQRINDARNFYDRLFAVERRGADSAAATMPAAEFFAHPLLQRPEKELTFNEKYYRFLVLYTWHKLHEEQQEALENSYKLVLLIRDNPERLQGRPLRFAVAISNYLNTCLGMNLYERFDKDKMLLDEIPAQTREEQAEVFQVKFQMELIRCLNAGRIDEGIAKVPELSRGLDSYAEIINSARAISLYYNVVLLYFIDGNYARALEWLHRIIQLTRTDSRMDIQIFARVLQPIVLYHLDRPTDALAEIEQCRTFPPLAAGEFRFEKSMLRFLQKIAQAANPQEAAKLCRAKRSELDEAGRELAPNRAFGIKVIRLWLDFMSGRKPMIDLYRRVTGRNAG